MLRRFLICISLLLVLISGNTGGQSAYAFLNTPTIQITSVPPWGSTGIPLVGQALKVTPADYRVAVFLFVPGLGWYTKPTCASPLTAIQANGTWSANITTGGVDDTATKFAVYLVPQSFSHPCVSGAGGVPATVVQQSVAHVIANRPNPNERQLSFSSYTWTVKTNRVPLGPDANYFSDSTDNVWVDEQGRLHLRITFRDGRWNCAEVIARDSFGYGTYRWYIDGPVDNFDRNVVFGLFTWSDDPAYTHRELDIEFSKWGQAANPNNAQYVVQPFQNPQNIFRFLIPPGINTSTHSFKWNPNLVFFQSLSGHYSTPPGASFILKQWPYSQISGIPLRGDETPRINLWLAGHAPPSNNQEVEVIIKRFEFIRNQVSDFDGDGKTDLAVFRPSNGTWYILRSSDNVFVASQFGADGDIPVPGDFDGDRKTDLSVFRPSTGAWYILQSSNGSLLSALFGMNMDKPVQGDYDGDGKTDIAVYRPSNGGWYYLQSSDGAFRTAQFGVTTDKPAPGDYDGDGKHELAVFRPNEGNWYLLLSSNGAFSVTNFGASTDRPAPGDYEGDGKIDLTVFRPTDSGWYTLLSSDNSFRGQQFGTNGDRVCPGDYDGDGKTDLGVWRPAMGDWYIFNSSDGSFRAQHFGQSGDIPIPSAYCPN